MLVEYWYRMAWLTCGRKPRTGSCPGSRWALGLVGLLLLVALTSEIVVLVTAVIARLSMMRRFGIKVDCFACCGGCLFWWCCPCLAFSQEFGHLNLALDELERSGPQPVASVVGAPAKISNS